MINTTTPAWLVESFKKVSRLAELTDNWDSYGAKPPEPAIIDFAIRILGWLEDEKLEIPSIAPTARGTIHFEWSNKGRELEVEVGSDGQFNYLKVFPDGSMEEKESELASPAKIRRLTQWLIKG